MTIQLDPQYKLRLPEELRDKIKESAKDHNRSMNADIVARLAASFESNSDLISTSKYDSLYKELKLTKESLFDISQAVLSLQEAFDSNKKPND